MEIVISMVVMVFMLLGFFYFTNNDINYGVSLVDDSIPQGTSITISYEIRNGFFSSEKNSVRLHYYIIGQTDDNIKLIGDMGGGQVEPGTVDISTQGIPHGEYTVKTELEYWIGGKGYIKFLTLELTIY